MHNPMNIQYLQSRTVIPGLTGDLNRHYEGLIHAILIKSHHLQRALKLDMTQDELAALLTPTHDYTISEIKDLLGALYLDIKVDIVPD